MSEKKYFSPCGCCGEKREETSIQAAGGFSLAQLPVGTTATIVKIMPQARGRKKFADIGLLPGAKLLMEAQAPFGGLLRVKVMESSLAIHKDEAAQILIRQGE